jgi:hypothetical protein
MPVKKTASKTKTAATLTASPYLRKEGLTFLRALVRANKKDPVEAREWFNANKATYEAELKEPMLAIIRHVTDAMLDFAPEHVRPAEKSLFRIYRDTRFSNDKRPYKDHIAAWWSHWFREDLGRWFLLPYLGKRSNHCRRRLHAGERSTGRNSSLAARSSCRVSQAAGEAGRTKGLPGVRGECAHPAAQRAFPPSLMASRIRRST